MAKKTSDKKMKDLSLRAGVHGISGSIVTVFLILTQFYYFRWVFAASVALLAMCALWEYYRLLKYKGYSPCSLWGMGCIGAFVFLTFLDAQVPYRGSLFGPSLSIYILALALFGCFIYYMIKDLPALVNISTTFFGIIYIGVPLSTFLLILFHPAFQFSPLEGTWWIIFLLVTTKSADMGGYFAGRWFGKHPLAKRLSPKKTLEGALGGLVFSLIAGLLVWKIGKTWGHVFASRQLLEMVFLSLLISVFGQLGDLAESLLKRDAGVKDSNKIPGVGGILDILDSLLFTSPVLYTWLVLNLGRT